MGRWRHALYVCVTPFIYIDAYGDSSLSARLELDPLLLLCRAAGAQ